MLFKSSNNEVQGLSQVQGMLDAAALMQVATAAAAGTVVVLVVVLVVVVVVVVVCFASCCAAGGCGGDGGGVGGAFGGGGDFGSLGACLSRSRCCSRLCQHHSRRAKQQHRQFRFASVNRDYHVNRCFIGRLAGCIT